MIVRVICRKKARDDSDLDVDPVALDLISLFVQENSWFDREWHFPKATTGLHLKMLSIRLPSCI